ncbi:hypothetical protein ACFVHB_27560 [Kitasatospora sp. NPDC127111]|uniref:hypothetical protein n=1 Tax=Kitasatospora sp. NPDC127111 TaxID=3345363 RepID=UPI003629AEAA
MRRLAMVTAAGVLAGSVAVAGCGSVRSDGTGTGTGATAGGGETAAPTASAPTAAGTGAPDRAEQARERVAEHDRLFPEVAALGCASAKAGPSATGTGSAVPVDPEAAKHAENSVYKQQAALTPEGRCRGEAHSARIAAALRARVGRAPLREDDVAGLLESLGYPRLGTTVTTFGDDLVFDLFVPGTGPCVSGRLTASTVKVETHGAYLEGGCTEPRGGH